MDLSTPVAPLHDAPVCIFDNDWGSTLAFAASLGRRQVPLHFYGSGVGRWSRYSTRRGGCPPVDDTERFLPWLRQRVRSGEIARVAPTTDHIAYCLAVLRADFPPEVQRTIAPLEEIEDSLVKTRFAGRCAAIGQATPDHAAPGGLDDALAAAQILGYPLILKPKSHLAVGWLDRGCVVRNAAQLRCRFVPYTVPAVHEALMTRYPELRWPMLQRYIPSARSRVYSVSGFKDADRGIVAACVSYKQRQWPPDVGTSTRQVAFTDGHILESGMRTIDRLLSRGIFELELLLDGEALLAIDLNPRAFGFMNLDIARGNDLPWLWFLSTLGPVEQVAMGMPEDALEARLVIPYWTQRLVERLVGQAAMARPQDAAGGPWVSMLGSGDDLVPLLLSNLRHLRHPRSLFRPFVAAAFDAPEEVAG